MIARYAPGERKETDEGSPVDLVVIWPVRGVIVSRKYLGWTDGEPWGEAGYIWHDEDGFAQCGLVVEEYAGSGDVEPMLVRFEQVSVVATDLSWEEEPDSADRLPVEMDEVAGYDAPMLAEPLEDELMIKLMLASEYIATNAHIEEMPIDVFVSIKWMGWVDLLCYLHYAVFEKDERELDEESWRTSFRQWVGEMLLIEAMAPKDG